MLIFLWMIFIGLIHPIKTAVAATNPAEKPFIHKHNSVVDLNNVLNGAQNSLTLGTYIQYTEAKNPLTIEQLVNGDLNLNWQNTERSTLALPRTPNPYWLNFTLLNSQKQSTQVYLYLDYALLEQIEVYQYNSATKALTTIATSGVNQAYYQRSFVHRAFVFPLNISANTQAQIFIKMKSESFFLLPLRLYTQQGFIEKEQQFNLAFGIALGILAVIIALSVFVAVTYQQTSFIYYACYSVSFFVFYSALKGFALEYLWPDQAYLSQPISFFALIVGLGFLNLFSISFLGLKNRAYWLYTTLFAVSCGCFVFSFVSLFLPHYYRISLAISIFMLSCILMLIAGLISVNKMMASKGYLFCFGLMNGAACLFVVSRFGWVNYSLMTEYSLIGSQFLAFFVLFTVLTERIKQSRRETLSAQLDAMHHYQQFYNIYQYAVEGHFTTTVDGKILHANKAFCELIGYSSLQDLLAQHTSITDFYVDLAVRKNLVENAQDKGSVLHFEAQWQTKDKQTIWVSLCLRYQNDADEGGILIGSAIDISSKKKADARLEFIAKHDSLTGLLNRLAFENLVTEVIKRSQTKQILHTLLYMDLDQFKLVNDTCGHKAGDAMLKQLTSELKMVLDKKGQIARLGGDEFGVLIPNKIDEQALLIANDLKQAVQDFRFLWGEQVFTLGVSIGMMTLGKSIDNFEDALSIADTACYAAKDKGRNRIHAYSLTDKDVNNRHDEMHQVGEIKQALEQNRFCLYAQTILSIQTRAKLKHYEVLLRMIDKNGQIVPPGLFLPAAERYGLMPKIDRWVINHYFKWLNEHPEQLEQLGQCAINLSGPSLADEDMQTFILDCFERYQIPFNKVCFEITESMAIQQLDETLEFIAVFKKLGCIFALDDFGSGFSSYGYLKNLPVNNVKIDGGFVKDMLQDPIDKAMVTSINEVAKAIGMGTVAEYVESKDILIELQNIGVNYAQGYAIAKPKPLSAMLTKNKKLETVEST